jgi:hypothetical protein
MPPADQRALCSYVWDYLKGWNVPAPAADDLQAHGVNTFLLHPESLPVPRFNPDRTALETVDFQVFDEALARLGHPRLHGVFWGETDGAKNWFDLDRPAERDCFKQWIRAWVSHLQERGFDWEDFFFYPYDEKIPERFVLIAQLLKEVDPRLRIYCNQVNVAPEIMLRIAPTIDIWCPYYRAELTAEQRQAFQTVREQYHPTVWTYACDGPAKALSPSTYYRRLPWRAFREGATGAGFWCYACTSNSWDDYDGSDPDYGVVYYASDAPPGVLRGEGEAPAEPEEAIIPSRRWEAWREGTEDYQYLHQLLETIRAARQAGVSAAEVEQAEQVLQQCLQDVLGDAAGNGTASVPSRYDQARRSLTEATLRLQQSMGQREEN